MATKLVLIITALALGACAAEPRAAAPAPAPPPPARAASPGDLGTAERALAAYLDASRDGSPTAAALDTLLGCGGRGAFVLPITLLGAYRVLPAAGAGDTLVGRAVVVTVAEQRADRRNRDRYLARQRVEVDTLEWDVVRSEEGGWQVCNGIQFGYHEAESATTWYPLGASRASVRRAADSVYRAWNGGSDDSVLERRF